MLKDFFVRLFVDGGLHFIEALVVDLGFVVDKRHVLLNVTICARATSSLQADTVVHGGLMAHKRSSVRCIKGGAGQAGRGLRDTYGTGPLPRMQRAGWNRRWMSKQEEVGGVGGKTLQTLQCSSTKKKRQCEGCEAQRVIVTSGADSPTTNQA
jgi:hypothetical protein